MIKNIIFDFDGVLVDSEILVAQSFCRYLSNLNIVFSENEFSNYAGKKTAQVIDELSKKFDIKNKQKFFDDIMTLNNDIYSKELNPVNGAKKFLENNNFNYFIGSNSIKKRILLGLKKVSFDKFISENKVFSFDMVEKPKPNPDIYLKVIETYNLDKSETIIVEDSAVGVKAGFDAGVKVFGLIAASHWYKDRSTKELLESGAFKIANNYENLLNEIKKI